MGTIKKDMVYRNNPQHNTVFSLLLTVVRGLLDGPGYKAYQAFFALASSLAVKESAAAVGSALVFLGN